MCVVSVSNYGAESVFGPDGSHTTRIVHVDSRIEKLVCSHATTRSLREPQDSSENSHADGLTQGKRCVYDNCISGFRG